jgi:hypothetical protein
MKSSALPMLGGLGFLAAGLLWVSGSAAPVGLAQGPAQPPMPQKLRILGPDVLERGTRHLLHIEGFQDGKTWKRLAPDLFTVKVTGVARAVDDPAGKPMNTVEILCDDVDQGKVTVEVRAADKIMTRVFAVGTAPPAGTFEAALNPAQVGHRFMGLGGGVLFYDNQFDITKSDDIYDWCFRDVRTSFLHVLIRSGCLPLDPKEDWRQVDLDKFDFSPLQRPLRIVKKALERNPDLKIFASLYSPPAWMKSNNSTNGKGTLKDGLRYRQELARYVFAYLKYAQRQGIPVHYLGFFNEPDFPHTQEGMYFADMGILVETFHECAKALDTLIAADTEVKKAPLYVFPDTLGAGAITRPPKNAQKIRERLKLLDRVGVWGVHDYWNQSGTYWNERFRELRVFPGVGAKPIWMTEWAQRERLGDLASGVEYGSNILNALRLGAEAWMVFEWCHPSGNQSGLISTDWGAKAPRSRYWRSKAYYMFRQIANTSPAGAQVLAMTGRWKGTSQANGHGVEYLALRDGERIIVHLQNTEPAPVTFRIDVAGTMGKGDGWTTTPLLDMVEVAAKHLAVSQKAKTSTVSGVVAGNSLVTFMLEKSKAP